VMRGPLIRSEEGVRGRVEIEGGTGDTTSDCLEDEAEDIAHSL